MLASSLLSLVLFLATPIISVPVEGDDALNLKLVLRGGRGDDDSCHRHGNGHRKFRGGHHSHNHSHSPSSGMTDSPQNVAVTVSPAATTAATTTTTTAAPTTTTTPAEDLEGNNALVASPSTTTAPTTSPTASPTTTPAAQTTSASSASSGLTSDEQLMLQLHNDFRAKYGAGPLTWNTEMATYARNYASKCVWAHSDGPYGENLAGGASIANGFKMWADEASDYDFANGGFSSATGHFTQVVWKGTTELGCASVKCTNGAYSPYIVCEYKKPGNIVGSNNKYFRENVGTLIG